MARRVRNFGFFIFIVSFVGAGYAEVFGFLKKYDVFLWPEVHGVLTNNGEPLSGVKIMREVIYDNDIVERTVTSGSGAFFFDELHINSRTPGKAFDETRTVQAIIAEYNDRKYLLWAHATDSIFEESLISEKLRNLRCDINNEEIYHHFPRPDNPSFTYNIKSICRW